MVINIYNEEIFTIFFIPGCIGGAQLRSLRFLPRSLLLIRPSRLLRSHAQLEDVPIVLVHPCEHTYAYHNNCLPNHRFKTLLKLKQ